MPRRASTAAVFWYRWQAGQAPAKVVMGFAHHRTEGLSPTAPADSLETTGPPFSMTMDDNTSAPRTGLDDISRIMVRVVLVLVAVLLGTTLMLLFYLSTLNRAPRTAFERDLAQWETAVDEDPGNAANWARLAYTYAEAGRTSEALTAVRRGSRATSTDTLAIVEADVLRSAGRYAESLAAYDKAEAAFKAAETEVAEKRKRMQIYVPIQQSSLAPVYFGRGLCKRELGDMKGAVTDLEKAVAELPGQVPMLVALGDLYAETGAAEKARATYTEALRFVPDDPDALKGLADLKGGGK